MVAAAATAADGDGSGSSSSKSSASAFATGSNSGRRLTPTTRHVAYAETCVQAFCTPAFARNTHTYRHAHTYAFARSHSYTLSLVHSSVSSFVHSFIRSLVRSCVRSFVHSYVRTINVPLKLESAWNPHGQPPRSAVRPVNGSLVLLDETLEVLLGTGSCRQGVVEVRARLHGTARGLTRKRRVKLRVYELKEGCNQNREITQPRGSESK